MGDLLTLHSHHAFNITLNPQGGLAGRRSFSGALKKISSEDGAVRALSRAAKKLTLCTIFIFLICNPVLSLIFTTILWTTSPTARFRRARGQFSSLIKVSDTRPNERSNFYGSAVHSLAGIVRGAST